MTRKRILLVLLTLAVSTLVAVGAYTKRTRGSTQGRPLNDHTRKVKGVLPPVRSTVPGVTLRATLRGSGDNEFAEIVIENNTDQGIDAYEIAADPRPSAGGLTSTQMSLSLDARRAQVGGETFKLNPDKPLILPHGSKTETLGLMGVPDGSDLTLTAVAFHRGAVVGTRAKQFGRDRAFEADKHGFHDELRALNAALEKEKQKK